MLTSSSHPGQGKSIASGIGIKTKTVLTVLAVSSAWCGAADRSLIFGRIRRQIAQESFVLKNGEDVNASMTANGSWSDITYSDVTYDPWKPVEHPTRLLSMAHAYLKEPAGSVKTDMLKNLILGFDFWSNNTSLGHSTNWYNNRIGAAIPWSKALVLMDSISQSQPSITQAKLTKWATYIDVPYTKTATSAHLDFDPWYESTLGNLTDEAQAHLNGCVARNASTCVDSIFNILEKSLQYTQTGDGIRPDGVQSAHGADYETLIYNGGYGQTYLKGVSEIFPLAAGTDLAFSTATFQRLQDIVLDGSARMIHATAWDPLVVGRNLARPTPAGTSSISKACAALLTGDYGRKADLQKLNTWLTSGGSWPWPGIPDKYFWSSQYLTHHGPGWMTSLRGVRKGVGGTETTNDENVKGWFIPFGSTWIRIRGDEQAASLWPTMDWARIPGLTCEHVTDFVAFNAKYAWIKTRNTGTTDFVGGVSDGQGASFAYDYSVDGVKAKKVWFQTPDAVIALAAGLTFSGKTNGVRTSVDQRLAHGSSTAASEIAAREKVTLGPTTGAVSTLATGSMNFTNLKWVHHDSVGYWFPNSEKLTVASQKQTGDWKDIGNGNGVVTENVFSVWIDHGTALTSGSYAYAVVPGVSANQMQNWVKNPPVIASNTTSIQAVSEGSWYGAAFYAAGKVTFSDGLIVEAAAPCVVVIRQATGGYNLTVADPGRTSSSMKIILTKGPASKTTTVALPTGSMAAGPSETKLVALTPTEIVRAAGSNVSTRLFRTGNQILVRDLPVGTNQLTLTDAQGKVLRVWPASDTYQSLDLPLESQANFLVVQGSTNLTLRVPPLF